MHVGAYVPLGDITSTNVPLKKVNAESLPIGV